MRLSLPSPTSSHTRYIVFASGSDEVVELWKPKTGGWPATYTVKKAVAMSSNSAAAPSGTYKGSKIIFGQSIEASLAIDDGTHFDLGITGPATIACAKEAYKYNTGSKSMQLPTVGKSGDCIHDALQKYVWCRK